jgi:pyruvate dehydrogenase E1 component
MLRQLERKVLWLSSYMIHHANHEVDRGDGLKVGGHQASSASLVTLMTRSISTSCGPRTGWR